MINEGQRTSCSRYLLRSRCYSGRTHTCIHGKCVATHPRTKVYIYGQFTLTQLHATNTYMPTTHTYTYIEKHLHKKYYIELTHTSDRFLDSASGKGRESNFFFFFTNCSLSTRDGNSISGCVSLTSIIVFIIILLLKYGNNL